MNANLRRHLLALSAISLTLAFASLASANPFATGIGVQFYNNGTSLTPSQTAGLVPQANFNSLAGNTFVNQGSSTAMATGPPQLFRSLAG